MNSYINIRTCLHVYVYADPPVFLTHPTSHIVTVGMTVTLYCNVSGYGISFAWERKTNGSSWSRIRYSQSYKYIVRNIQQFQQYRCIAGNPAGTFISNVATIEVLGKHVCNWAYENQYKLHMFR